MTSVYRAVYSDGMHCMLETLGLALSYWLSKLIDYVSKVPCKWNCWFCSYQQWLVSLLFHHKVAALVWLTQQVKQPWQQLLTGSCCNCHNVRRIGGEVNSYSYYTNVILIHTFRRFPQFLWLFLSNTIIICLRRILLLLVIHSEFPKIDCMWWLYNVSWFIILTHIENATPRGESYTREV